MRRKIDGSGSGVDGYGNEGDADAPRVSPLERRTGLTRAITAPSLRCMSGQPPVVPDAPPAADRRRLPHGMRFSTASTPTLPRGTSAP